MLFFNFPVRFYIILIMIVHQNQNLNNNNNNDNDLYNNTPSGSSSIISRGRFAPSQSSPGMQDTSSTNFFGSLNVRGLNVRTKFNSILDDLFHESLLVPAHEAHQIKNYCWRT